MKVTCKYAIFKTRTKGNYRSFQSLHNILGYIEYFMFYI